MLRRWLAIGLLVILGVVSLANLIYAMRYFFATRDQQRMNGVVRMINHNRALAQSLAADAFRYSEKNPAINPILVQFGVKTNVAPAPSPPGTKKP